MTERDTAFEYQPALDGIRALAVLAVIAYHDAYVWAKGGFLGVDAFFVLSGFLITTLLVLEWQRAQSIALVAFWGRRVRRLLPALLLVILFVAIYGAIAVPPHELDRLRGDGLAGLFYVANWRFIVAGQSYFDLFTSPSPFRHLWSLAIEEQFYLVWPLVVLGCLRVARGRLRVLVGVCVVGVIGSVFLMSALFDANDPSRAYYGTDSRAHTLLVGCLLALLLLVWKPTSRQARIAVQALGVVGGLGAIWAWYTVRDVEPGYYGIGSLVYAIAIAAVIAAAVQPGRGLVRSPLSWRPLRWIGTISYGLYLWHWPIDIWLVHWRVGFGGSALNALRLAVTFAFATASYYLVERPIRRGHFLGLRRPTLRWVAPAGILTVALTLMISTAGAAKAPTYFGVGVHPTVCPQPRPDELHAAQRALHSSPPVERNPSGHRPRVLLVGDSIACSLWPGLKVVGPKAGLKVDQGAVIACGITGSELVMSAVVVPPNTSECSNLVHATVQDALKRSRPDVVLWVSLWERADLKVGGRTLKAGTKAWDRAVTQRLERTLRMLRAHGARVVVASQAPAAPGRFHQIQETDEGVQDASFARLNQLLLQLAARHPGAVTYVDLAGKVCPGGPPCPAKVDGMTIRPFDGAHFSPQGAVWAAEWLVPSLETPGGKPPAGT
ncbi:MAG: acyltransferase family protein [Acidimicrobiia bacterium]